MFDNLTAEHDIFGLAYILFPDRISPSKMSSEEKYRAAYEFVFGKEAAGSDELQSEEGHEEDDGTRDDDDNAEEGIDEYSSGTEFSSTMDECPDEDDGEDLEEEEEEDGEDNILDELAEKVNQARLSENELDSRQVNLKYLLWLRCYFFLSLRL